MDVLFCVVKYVSDCHTRKCNFYFVASSGASKVRFDLYFTLQNRMSNKKLTMCLISTLPHKLRVKTYVARQKHERERSCVAKTRARARFSESSVAKHVLKCMTGRLDVQKHVVRSTLGRSDVAKHVVILMDGRADVQKHVVKPTIGWSDVNKHVVISTR